jgi:hypothetical protein
VNKKGETRRVSHDMQLADWDVLEADNADALERRMEEGMNVNAVDGNG